MGANQARQGAEKLAGPAAGASGKKLIRVDVVSDTVWPWCFVGKRRMEAAMRKLSHKAEFEVRWLPFQLNPAAPGGDGVNKLQVYKQKFGEDRVAAMLPQMLATGAQDGINFSYGGNTGNTYDSHRLISFAAKQDKQDAIVEELFSNYFEQEKCISDRRVLVAAAEKVGVEGAAEMLESSAERSEVDADLREYQSGKSISGVPYFIVNGGEFQESGAIASEEFVRIFSRVA